MDVFEQLKEDSELGNVLKQFEQWRHNREKREPIPEKLWEAAASLHPSYSLYKISKTLRLNHSKLKQYVCGHSPAIGVPGAPSFIELGLSGPMETYQCTVEMRDQDGAQMRIHVNGKGLDLMKLVRQFWMRQK